MRAADAGPGVLLPWPSEIHPADGRLVLHNGLPIVVSPSAPMRVHEIAELLSDGLRSAAGITTTVKTTEAPAPAGAIRLMLATKADGVPANPEGYTLTVAQTVELKARDPRGLIWGVQTLLQRLDRRTPHEPALACGRIVDAPAYAWRAVMLDPVRSFLDLDFLRRTIRVMSAYKLNILHLHLTDDQAWRFESKAFPRCNPPGEPCYTQAELKDLVAYAEKYGVEIVPEFDFPGHAHAAVAAYPELDCEGKSRPMDEAIFCSAKPFTWEFIDKVVAEAAAIFPSHYIHLGADEPFAVKRWATCPYCQARMKERGVTTTAGLYHTFVADLDAIAKKHGKQLVVWNDAITPGVAPLPPRDILLDAWTNPAKAIAQAQDGYTLINSSIRPLYLSSFSQRDGFPLRSVWEWTPRVFGLREARTSDPDLKTVPLPGSAQVAGGQACAWAAEQGVVERRLYPRLLAVAETLWTGNTRPDYADFAMRLATGQWARLHQLGVPDYDHLPKETLFAGADLAAWNAAPTTRWFFVDDVLHASAGARETLWTNRDYRDFSLSFDRQSNQDTGETGFVIRCAPIQPGSAPRGFVVRSSPPAGMKIGAGDVRDLKGWNHFELVARGSIVSLTVNGYLAWSVMDPAPRAGPIALVTGAEGYDVKNVELRLLDLPGSR
ncbi:MAG TPA: family 20 glycosylhydrolase [Opitutus sp.]|nr:family 20 glycosylhydrolase [Opitutus sp.]